ncbi:MAG: hypothetical protein F4Z66_06290, partial [Gammaproteobacteria bacterium]|nr:hypothetical protein [Gammaproteobacteria bacterium]
MPRKKKGKFTTAIWVLGSLTVIAIIVGALSQSEESSSNEEIDLQQAANTQEQQDMNVELVKESIYDVPIKTQIDQRWYVTQVPESEDSLRTLINTLHERAQERREFKHHNPATNIYIYVYQDEDTAKTEQKGADWLGMSQKSYSDRTNKVTINANRLAKMNETPEIRSGLEAHVRKQIFEELVKSEERA